MEESRVRYLTQKEKQDTRSMYEAAFPEDSQEFVDYYYHWKTRDNEIIVMEGTEDFEDSILQVMLHLNPYTLCINGKYQTVTYFGVQPEKIREIVLQNQLMGVDRIVPFGKAMDIGIIWDGYDIIRSLSRIVALQ